MDTHFCRSLPRPALWLLTAALWLTALPGGAEIAVIVHPSNPLELDITDIYRLYLGKRKDFPDGRRAIPVDQVEGARSRASFIDAVLNKTDQQLKSYWSYKLFTGKGTPPIQLQDDIEVKQVVAANPATIGYVDAAVVDETVKVIYLFGDTADKRSSGEPQ